MIDDLELRHLRHFVALAEELHFTRAAERLGVAQPALSQQIRQLEERLGHRLLERRPRVRLTAAGDAFLPRARRVLEEAADAVESSRRAARGESGRVRVGLAGSMAVGFVPAILRRFGEGHPDVALEPRELSTTRQIEALERGEIDLGFLREPGPPGPGLVFETLTEEPFAVLLPPGHPLAERERVPLGALAGEAFVLFPRAVAPTLHDRIIAFCGAAGFRPRVVQESRSWLTIVALVEAGFGVSLVPGSFRKLQWGESVYRPLEEGHVRSVLALGWRAASLSPAAEALARIARASFG